MKKIIAGLLVVFASTCIVTGCTEEEVKPKNEAETSPAGGNAGEAVVK